MGRLRKGQLPMTNEERREAAKRYNKTYYEKNGNQQLGSKGKKSIQCGCGGCYKDIPAYKRKHFDTNKHQLWKDQQKIYCLYIESGIAKDNEEAKDKLNAYYDKKKLYTNSQKDAHSERVISALEKHKTKKEQPERKEQPQIKEEPERKEEQPIENIKLTKMEYQTESESDEPDETESDCGSETSEESEKEPPTQEEEEQHLQYMKYRLEQMYDSD